MASIWTLKGIVHPKIQILSLFMHPHVDPNLYDLLDYKSRQTDRWTGTEDRLIVLHLRLVL